MTEQSMESIKKNIILAFELILDSRFVQSSALIAVTRRVSPLVQKNRPEGVKADTLCIAYRAKTNTETIMMYTKILQEIH